MSCMGTKLCFVIVGIKGGSKRDTRGIESG